MKTYQYDTVGDIYIRLGEIERLLEVIAGVKTLREYEQENEMRRQCVMMDMEEEDET